jgi:hypothetical protein
MSTDNVGRDYVLAFMKANGIPVTRANYLEIAYFGDILDPDQPLDAELESELPEEIQLEAL